MKMNETIYINGIQHRSTELSEIFFIDSPELPGRPCAQHSLTKMAIAYLKFGGQVHTSGNSYNLRPTKPE